MKRCNSLEEFGQEFDNLLKSSRTFLLMPHINMDGDALGSTLAIFNLLKSMDKAPLIFTTDEVPSIYDFLPGVENVKHSLPDFEFDCAILFECPDYSRSPARADFRAKTIINIDHHPDNSFYGDLNFVDAKASAIGEFLFELLLQQNYPIDRDIILNLFVAVFTDTGGFQYANTSTKTLKVVSEMLKRAQLHIEEISRRVFQEMDHNVMSLLGKLMASVQIYKDEGFAVSYLSRAMMNEHNVSDADAANYMKDLNVIKGVHTFALLRETGNGRVRVSLRSRKIPINEVAKKFGGGGHERAAGCTVTGDLDEVGGHIIGAIREKIEKYKDTPLEAP